MIMMMMKVDPPGLVVDPGHVTPATVTSPLASPSPGGLAPDSTPGTGSDHEWNYDPNEPRYCICNQVGGTLTGSPSTIVNDYYCYVLCC